MLVDPATRKAVMELMHQGKPLAYIDRFLQLPKGTAHDVVVDYWREDKERDVTVRRAKW